MWKDCGNDWYSKGLAIKQQEEVKVCKYCIVYNKYGGKKRFTLWFNWKIQYNFQWLNVNRTAQLIVCHIHLIKIPVVTAVMKWVTYRE